MRLIQVLLGLETQAFAQAKGCAFDGQHPCRGSGALQRQRQRQHGAAGAGPAVELGSQALAAGERLSINWIAANRDPRAFDEPDSFRIDRDPSPNLLYGAGIHVCPGAPLARLELRVLMEELLARTSAITLAESRPPVRAVHPDAGYAALLVRLV